MRYCLPPFACFAVDMCRRIFTRVFRQKEKFIATESGPRPFCLRSSIVVPGMSRTPLDLKILKPAAKHFVGTHDFAGFAANRGKPEPSTIRTINSVRVRKKVRASRSSSTATASSTRWFA